MFFAGVVGNGNETCNLWSRFSQLNRDNALNNKINDNGYEIRIYAEDGNCECHVGVSIKDSKALEAYKVLTLEPSMYAVFEIYPSQGYTSQNKAMQEWLDANVNNYKQTKVDGKSFSVLVYDERYKGENDPASVVGIWVPISSALK